MGITSRRFLLVVILFLRQNKLIMNELVERLSQDAGLTPEQAQKAIETIANFVKEKFPMLGGAVDQIFAAGGNQ